MGGQGALSTSRRGGQVLGWVAHPNAEGISKKGLGWSGTAPNSLLWGVPAVGRFP